jgi:serine/threonine protein kinase
MPLQNGVILNDRYRILRILGKGGFGAVYRAADMVLKFPCAVKENLDTSPEARKQFEKEAVILASLSHPNLPRVRDHFIIPDQGQYLVMDFIEGEDLHSLVQRSGVISEDQALNWINQIASALNYLHSQSPPIIHRDIKPANIRITPKGTAYLVDFGLVKVYDPHMRTTIGARGITPGYSPPEQYGRGRTDPRTDIYALSATLYTLLTGLEPQESIQRMVSDNIIPLNSVPTQVHPGLEEVIGKGMQLQPSQRYPSIAEFTHALKHPDSQETSIKTQVIPTGRQTQTAPFSPAVERRSPIYKKIWFWGIICITLAALFFSIRAVLSVLQPAVGTPTQEVAENSGIELDPLESQEEVNLVTSTEITQPTATALRTDIPPTSQVQLVSTQTNLPPTDTLAPPNPEFTANVNMFCRDGPSSDYEAHTTIMAGETLPVIAKWENGWFLVGIDDPSTRTRCCWVVGDGQLNVSLSSIQTINYLVDRITCNPR